MNSFYELNGQTFYEKNTVLIELSKLLRNNQNFTINYPIYDSKFVEELFSILNKYRVEANYIKAAKDSDLRDDLVWTISGTAGQEGLTIITEEGAKYIYNEIGQKTIGDLFLEVAEKGGQVVLELDPYVGIFVRIIGVMAGGILGRKTFSWFKKRYLLRNTISPDYKNIAEEDRRISLIGESIR